MDEKILELIVQMVKNNPNTYKVFLDSDTVDYDDKIDIATKSLNKNQLVRFAILCAQSVQHIFEEKYPEDKSVANLLNYLSEIKDFNNLSDEQIKKIEELKSTAANDTYYAASAVDADVDAYYAYYTAYYAARATSAVDADVDVDAYYTAYYAACATSAVDAAAKNKKQQEELNISFLKKVVDV